ncbi:hypothetical protein CC2G_005339 [Coprinopsis cinerea AmutBmut pab1-1]|nr:hypothetical protein CC2G_005339 [Coprinopsis cinerea AmutBmut pab1-1]
MEDANQLLFRLCNPGQPHENRGILRRTNALPGPSPPRQRQPPPAPVYHQPYAYYPPPFYGPPATQPPPHLSTQPPIAPPPLSQPQPQSASSFCATDSCKLRNGSRTPGNQGCIERKCKTCCSLAYTHSRENNLSRERCVPHKFPELFAVHQPSSQQHPIQQPQTPEAPTPNQGPRPHSPTPPVHEDQSVPILSQPQAAMERRRELAQPMAKEWMDARNEEMKKESSKSMKTRQQELENLERRTVTLVIYHTAGQPPLVYRSAVKSWPKAQLKDFPSLMRGLKLDDDSVIDVFSGTEWYTATPDTVIPVEFGCRLLIRARPDWITPLTDMDCPGIAQEYDQQPQRRPSGNKRSAHVMASPLQKAPRLANTPSATTLRPQPLPLSKVYSPSRSPSPPTSPSPVVAPAVVAPVHREPLRPAPFPLTTPSIDVPMRSVVPKSVDRHVYYPVHKKSNAVFPMDYYMCDVIDGLKHLKYLKDHKGQPVKSMFSKVFIGAKYVKSQHFNYRKHWSEPLSSLVKRYISYGKGRKGAFSLYMADFKRGASGTTSSESESSDESEVEVVGSTTNKGKETEINRGDGDGDGPDGQGDDDAVSQPYLRGDIDNDKGSNQLCPFCDNPLPANLSPNLKCELERLVKQSTPDPLPHNPGHRSASFRLYIHFCAKHKHEGDRPKAVAHGWPSTINFTSLPGRIRSYKDEIYGIIDDPEASEFFTLACESRRPSSSRAGPQGYDTFTQLGAG